MDSKTEHIVIIGAGIAGISMGIHLKQAGIDSFTIIEKADALGGTWRDNTYPGCAADTPAQLYSFSFAPKPDWIRVYAPHSEIRRYLEECARQFELITHIKFNTEVTEARYDEAACLWHIKTADGETLSTKILIGGTGQLGRAHIPNYPGLSGFHGEVFHSAQWRHDIHLHGKHVAVIGTGASAVQFLPPIAPLTAGVTVFQRSPNWVLPLNNSIYSPILQSRFKNTPWTAKLYRRLKFWRSELRFFRMKKGSSGNKKLEMQARRYLASQIADPVLRSKLTPDYPIGCKQILASDDYFQALKRSNVYVETNKITKVEPYAVVTADGNRHPAQVIILATGFETRQFLAPIRIVGRQKKVLSEQWNQTADAYLGMSVAGFPNFFLLYGPNTHLAQGSTIFMIECQSRYLVKCIQAYEKRGIDAMEVKPDVVQKFTQAMQTASSKTVFTASCTSWYKTSHGKVLNVWPGYATQYWWQTRKPKLSHFQIRYNTGL